MNWLADPDSNTFVPPYIPFRGLRLPLLIVVVCSVSGVALLIVLFGLRALVVFHGITAFVLLSIVACTRPTLTILAWLFSTVVLNEIIPYRSVPVGGAVDLRYSDPIFFGMIGALVLSLLIHRETFPQGTFRKMWLWVGFAGWMLLRAAQSVENFGIVPVLGQFRSYCLHSFILPYVIVFFQTEERREQLFRSLLFFSVALAGLALVKGGVEFSFTFSASQKWLGAHGSIALLFGCVALTHARRENLISNRTVWVPFFQLVCLMLLIITSHRSVWLAAAAGSLLMIGTKQISFATAIKFVSALIVTGFLISIVFRNIDLIDFLNRRLEAFFAHRRDSTASWRMRHWLEALGQIRASLLTGGGIGSYFETFDTNGNPVRVSLHNEYVQLVFQFGIIGLILYLGFILRSGSALYRALRVAASPLSKGTLSTALLVLASASAFYLAYGFDYTSWVYLGLGLATSMDAGSLPSPKPGKENPFTTPETINLKE